MYMRRISRVTILALLTALLCSPACFVWGGADSSATADAAGTGDFKVVGYYCGEWFDIPVEKLQAEKLTHVIYGFIVPRDDGSCKPFEEPEELAKLIGKCHDSGAKVYIATGGYSDKDGAPLARVFEKIAADDALREKFIGNVTDIVNLYGFDGVELDWEYPKPSTSGDFERLVSDLRDKLYPLGKGLSAALPGTGSTDGQNVWDALPSVSDAALSCFDFIELMCYDLAGYPNHSPIWFSDTSIAYWNKVRNVPAEKIILGMPLYARPSWIQYHALVEMDKENAYRDYAATTPLESTYNGLNTLREKTMLALRKAGGVMLFDVNEDTYDDTSAVSMIHYTLGAMAGLSDKEIDDYIWVVIDNQPVAFDKSDGMGLPFIDDNDRTLVPARKVLEAIRADVEYATDDKGRVISVSAVRSGVNLTINIGGDKYSVNGETKSMDTTAIIKERRTYLPARTLLEAFGFEVTYSAVGKTVYADE